MDYSIQDKIFDNARHEDEYLTVHLVNGYKIVGKVAQFDDSTLLMSSDSKHILVYKHAISTITLPVPLAPKAEAPK